MDVHVPMIIRHPAMKQPGLQDHQVVELVDLFPTLADLSGASLDK
jgi:arylsulfatase A-like enzyme